jgi:1,4-dihydroxy-2-naphthoate octaprenyltransferase
MKKLKYIFGPMRLPFLILTPGCVLLGVSSAFWSTGFINLPDLFLLLIGGILAHISVNTFNEYFDFKSGLDFHTTKTLFNGGSGTLIEQPHRAIFVLTIAWISIILTALIGFYFISAKGFSLLPIGLTGIILIYSYTKWITKHPYLCLIAPGTGFGIIMVLGSHFALTAEYSISSFYISLVPFFLVNNLLLLNQFPDLEADRTVGRRHFPIVYGKKVSAGVYGIFLMLTYLVIIFGVWFKHMPDYCLLGLTTAVFMIPVYFKIQKHADSANQIFKFLPFNVLNTILTPILVSIGLFIG